MAKLFSVASWNVEHFRGAGADAPRIDRVVNFMAEQNPDLFALYEVEGATIFSTLVDRMPGYTFQITEGEQTQEILVGVKKTMTAFITQKIEYKSGTTHMRPGQLVTLRIGQENYSILFLHIASGNNPRGMGLRDDMVQRAFDFRKVLDNAQGGTGHAKYIFVGDLNSMGLKYPFDRSIGAELELKKWDREGSKVKIQMRRLAKTHPNSWSNGSASPIPDSSLDHVYASQQLGFKMFVAADGSDAQVAVRGWTAQPTDAAKDKWIKDFSDHALLYFEVHD